MADGVSDGLGDAGGFDDPTLDDLGPLGGVMSFAEANEWLNRHINREAVAGDWDTLSLVGPERLMAIMGDPHRAFPVIHVTGTNGKGTVSRMIERLLSAAGLTVGVFASPHLESITERMSRSGDDITESEFGEVIGGIAAMEAMFDSTPSYFELLTAAAFRWFSDTAVDVAVVEVGIFGRFDATNVVDAEVAVITNVGKDHTDGEGEWQQKIAFEKAGIIKPDSAVVLGPVADELASIFSAEPHRVLFRAETDFELTDRQVAVGGQMLAVHTPFGDLDEVYLPLHGEHQGENAAIALMAAEAFFGRALQAEIVQTAMAAVEGPGRFEVISVEPLVVLDTAHNVPAAAAVVDTLNSEITVSGTRIAVVGMLERNADEVLAAFDIASFDVVIACTPDSGRAIPAPDLAASARALGASAEVVPTVADAVERALVIAGELDLILITGSAYTVGEARRHLRTAFEARAPEQPAGRVYED